MGERITMGDKYPMMNAYRVKVTTPKGKFYYKGYQRCGDPWGKIGKIYYSTQHAHTAASYAVDRKGVEKVEIEVFEMKKAGTYEYTKS